jgi:hypothetical protein
MWVQVIAFYILNLSNEIVRSAKKVIIFLQSDSKLLFQLDFSGIVYEIKIYPAYVIALFHCFQF